MINKIYIINKEWYLKWKAFVKAEDFKNDFKETSIKRLRSAGHPGKINNFDIVHNPKEFINDIEVETNVIKEDMKEKIKLISASMWFFFFKQYEGGPEIKRSLIEVEEDYDVKSTFVFDLFYKIVNLLVKKGQSCIFNQN
jgi:hypothetical protein